MQAKFIVFEGLDGSGKSTQIRLLEEKLTGLGHRIAVTAEPTASATGGLVRDALCAFTPRTAAELAVLFAADRVAHNVNPIWGIEKMLKDGRSVICDRYYYSSLAYQGSVTDADWVRDMNLNCPDIRKPDLCIFLDVDYERCCERMEGDRAFREIFENRDALKKIRDRYFRTFEELRERDNIAVIDAARPVEEVAADVFSAVKALFSEEK